MTSSKRRHIAPSKDFLKISSRNEKSFALETVNEHEETIHDLPKLVVFGAIRPRASQSVKLVEK